MILTFIPVLGHWRSVTNISNEKCSTNFLSSVSKLDKKIQAFKLNKHFLLSIEKWWFEF
jgi:hypothetical protein